MRNLLTTAVASACVALTLTCPPARAAEHPRLFFGAEDVPALRAKIKTEPFASMFKQLEEDTLKHGGWPGEAYDDSQAYHVSLRAQRAGFMYVLTGEEKWAKVAREHTQRTIDSKKEWANAGTKGLALYWHASRIACAYDWCYGSDAWGDAFSATVSKALAQHGQVILDKGGRAQNTSPASNWQGGRFGSGGLAMLASDEPIDPKHLSKAEGKVARFLTSNLGGDKTAGWNSEGLGYNYYPMGNFVGPFLIAYARNGGPDLRQKYGPQLSGSYWSVYAAYVPSMGGIRPDWADDNPGTAFEGTLGQAFYFCDKSLLPGLVYWYDRIDGKAGRNDWDSARGGTIWSILYHPGDAVEPADPMSIEAWTSKFEDAGGIGLYTFRNAYEDENDIVAQYLVKRYAPGGHSGPDAASFRILGLGGAFAVGGGRYGPKLHGVGAYKRSMNTVYPADPEAGPIPSNNSTGKLLAGRVDAQGSGYVVSKHGSNNVGTTNLTRRFLADLSGDSGAAGLFVVADTSDNGRFWQLCTIEDHRIAKTADGFVVTAPNGATLKATVLAPAGEPKVTTGTRIRGSGFGPTIDKNNYAYVEGDGVFTVVLTLQPKGKPHPASSHDAGTVTVGAVRVKVGDESIERAK